MTESAAPVYLLLGELQFEVPSGLNQLDFSQHWNWVKHGRIGREPELQPNGQDLLKLSLRLQLHIQIVDVDEQIRRLKEAGDKLEPLALDWGRGLANAQYYLQSLTVSSKKTDAEGLLILAEVSLDLVGKPGTGTERPATPSDTDVEPEPFQIQIADPPPEQGETDLITNPLYLETATA